METEFKYRLDDTSVFDSIVETAAARNVGIEEVETIDMHAAYFDTEDFDFRKRGIAYRIRQEDDRCTVTIKWDVNVKEGLHRREEFNLVVNESEDIVRRQVANLDIAQVLNIGTQGGEVVLLGELLGSIHSINSFQS
jgi:inorganic triphosphatase YgiF